jgi:N-acetylmuramoyl-L-alanine amidase/transposase-like protein
MSKKLIALDDGHGMSTAGKRTPPIAELGGRVIHENEFNREVVRLTDIELKRCGFDTLLTAPTDADVSLSARTNLANSKKADFLISFHFNAMTGRFETSRAEGFSVHVHSLKYESAKLGRIVLKHLAQGTKQKNRGLVQQNLHMTRETKMPAILIEFGFMDNKREAMLMIDKGFQKECAVEVAKAVCEYYGVAYKAESKPAPKPAPKPQPTSNAKMHTVEKGDTYSKISREYGVTVAQLRSYNPRIDENKLQIGDVIHLIPVPNSGMKPAPAPKPQPKPAPKPKKEYVVLPRNAETWKTYRLDVQPISKNSDWSLTPSAFSYALEYEILDKPYPHVVTILTSRGKRNIYVHPSTGAKIITK